jgi:hypothetical protein
MQELFPVSQIVSTLGGEMLKALAKTPSQEPNDHEEILEILGQGER